MQHSKFDDARMLLQTLINTYPDSEFLARAKLGIGDTWYADGSTASLTQAEAEYKDFIAFFPNLPEAAEAQLKIPGSNTGKWRKPDRDYAHAHGRKRNIERFCNSIRTASWGRRPRSDCVKSRNCWPTGNFVLAILLSWGAWAAAIARLQSLVDAYPLV